MRASHVVRPLGAAAAALLAVQVQAQADPAYPTRPVRLLIPAATGSPAGLVGRAISEPLGPVLGQPVVVEERPGANGTLAMVALAGAAPDGHVLCLANNSTISMNPFVYKNLPYDPERDFAPIINTGFVNGVILVHPSVPAKTMRELIDLAKASPGKLNWATWGVGSFAHLTMEWTQSNTGAAFLHVPYKTPGHALQAVLAGEAHVTQNNPGITLAQIKAGKLKPLVLAGHKRSAILPGIPSFVEDGYELDFAGWNGVFAPVRTPGAIVRRLNAEIGRILADSGFVARFLTPLGIDPVRNTPEEFAAFLKSDRQTAAKVIKLAGIQPQ
ncbi:MAG: tripartite tricarboxylate transporter substrate binding protein [Burkholderiales bacterium]|nr:tripartite tricarboxylate transporter substrate binding protein [Burkholderiales bacterium]